MLLLPSFSLHLDMKFLCRSDNAWFMIRKDAYYEGIDIIFMVIREIHIHIHLTQCRVHSHFRYLLIHAYGLFNHMELTVLNDAFFASYVFYSFCLFSVYAPFAVCFCLSLSCSDECDTFKRSIRVY
jgi:hypothetical protein